MKYKIYFHLKRSLWTTTNRENRSFMRIVKQNWFKNLGELHKEWTEAGTRNLATVVVRGVLPGLRRRRTGQLPSRFQMRKCFVFHLETKVLESGGEEAHSPSCLKSSVKFLVCDDLVCNVICWCWSIVFLKTNVTAPIYQEILEHFMLPSADKLFKDSDFIFQQDLPPAHTAKSTKVD